MPPLRLLLIDREPHPSFRPEVQVLHGQKLPERGIAVTLAAPAGPGAGRTPWTGGGELVLTGSREHGARLLRNLSPAASLCRALPALVREADIVVSRDVVLGGLWAARLAHARGAPFVSFVTFPYPEDDLLRSREAGLSPLRRSALAARGRVFGRLLYHHLMPGADHNLVISEQLRLELAARGLDPETMTPCPMGVDAAAAAAVEPADTAADPRLAGRRLLCYLGALNRVRRPEFLLNVLALVRAEVPEAMLVMVGDAVEAADRAWFEGEIRARNLSEHVVVTGWLQRARAWALAAACEVGLCALPGGFVFRTMSPTKAVELLALGLPVVTAGNPDQERLVEAGGGLACPYEAESFARAVLKLLADPDRARAMGAKGREHVAATRGYDLLADNLAALYRNLVLSSQRE